jgi:hypothetical protein
MDVLAQAQLAALAARLQLNARNGNVVNESAPGFAVRPAKGAATRAAAASAYSATTTAKPASPRIPAAYAKLPVDVAELLPHLSNARELYSAKSAVGKNALQLYGTMVDVLDDDMDDSMIEDDMSIIEETEIEHEAVVHVGDEPSAEGDSADSMQVAGTAFDARG